MTSFAEVTMNIVLQPDLERYVEAQANTGRFASAVQVVEHALSRLMTEDAGEQIDDETHAALLRSLQQSLRGKGIPVAEARRQFQIKNAVAKQDSL
jgi:Arc/MetJ-type ribon-helix-helix transcriptional regulator